ncbi:proteasome accessory factor C [Mycobacterium tuberculosis]|nr:proteasome accessory factor C [Mycobacterium tuberculosis]
MLLIGGHSYLEAWSREAEIRELRQLPDGSCEVAMTYASEDWMTRLLLGFGSDVRVLAPESLAQRVRDAATAALDAYQAAAPP